MKKKTNLLVAGVVAALLATTLASCNKGTTTSSSTSSSEEVQKTYTYVDALSSTPSSWNIHTWKENTQSIIFGYTEMGLYDFALGTDNKGYKIVPEMADGEPVDDSTNVTPEEVEKYGMTGATDEAGTVQAGSKWLINLNKKAVWQDGTAINADTYVDSMDRFLDPKMANYRASSWYDGDVVLGNAKSRYEAGRSLYNGYLKGDGTVAAITRSDDKYYGCAYAGFPWISTNYSIYSLYHNYGIGAGVADVENVLNDTATWGTSAVPKYVDLGANQTALANYCTAWVYMLANAFGMSVTIDPNLNSPAIIDENTHWTGLSLAFVQSKAPDFSFDNVGIKKVSDYQIALYLQKPASLFNLKMQLSGNWIVKTDLYDAAKTTVGDLVSTKYATALDNYMSYGPYKLTVFTADKEVKVERNDKWYGYTDGSHTGQFSITAVDMPVVSSLDTQLLMFEQGQLDSIALRAADMKKYSTSPYLMYTPQSYTDKIALNSSFDKLKERQSTGVNKTILANKKFRQALSWALDRKTFVQTETAGSTPALGVINDMYVADEATGVLYRDTDVGKRVISDIYGDSKDGFNLAKAKQLITEACTEEAASTKEGHWTSTDKVSLEFVVYNEDWRTAIQNHIDDFVAATAGTPLEGKFEVTITITEKNQDAITAGNAELCMDIWGGAQMNPYGIPDTWINADNRTCYGFNPDAETIDIDVNGDGTISADEKHTNTEWYNLLNNTTYSAAKEKDYKVRALILSWLEEYMLQQQYFIAVRARNSVSIDSFRVKEGTDEYQALVGYGGMRSMQLTQSDQEWAGTAAKGLDYTK